MSEKQQTYFEVFKSNLEKGLNYYTSLLDTVKLNSKNALENTLEQIEQLRENLKGIQFKQLTIV
jgi:hypothetical protein